MFFYVLTWWIINDFEKDKAYSPTAIKILIYIYPFIYT